MPFSDLALAKRLERAEGHACVQFADARRRLDPESGAEWMECAGAYVVFDTAGSPVTQTFGLGLFEPLTPCALDTIERFFLDRGAPVHHEVSPFAGLATHNLLCARNYRLCEIGNVLCRHIERQEAAIPSNIAVRVVTPPESQLWARTNAGGWAQEHPEYQPFFLELGAIICERQESPQQDRFLFTKAWRFSLARPHFPNFAVVACKLLCYTHASNTHSNTAAISP
jgi:hypothetical protein